MGAIFGYSMNPLLGLAMLCRIGGNKKSSFRINQNQLCYATRVRPTVGHRKTTQLILLLF